MTVQNITSQNGKLLSGTKEDNIQNLLATRTFRNEKAKEKALSKRIQLFEKYDENKDDTISAEEIEIYNNKMKKQRNWIIAGAVVGTLALGVGITYLAKTGKISSFLDKITQNGMKKNLEKAYGDGVQIEKGAKGSLFIPSDADAVPNWKVDGKTDFDKFIKRYGMTAVDDTGAEVGKYTMASRGTMEASGNVTMTIPTYKDKYGRTWTMIQEEARPIDILRRGKDARVLAFPAGCIGDEAQFLSESAKDCAIRELSEETGVVASKIKDLNPQVLENGQLVSVPIMTSPGLTDESTYFYQAVVESFKPSSKATTDGGVTRGWHFVPLKNIQKWFEVQAQKGKIASGQTLTGLSLLG